MLKCMRAALCVRLPVALARLLPPPRLHCPQTDCSPTAAPAHCFNTFRRGSFLSRLSTPICSTQLESDWEAEGGRPGFWGVFLFVCWRKAALCSLNATTKKKPDLHRFTYLVLWFKPPQIPVSCRLICFFETPSVVPFVQSLADTKR